MISKFMRNCLVQYPQTDQKKHARPTSPSRALIYTGKPKRSIGLALGSHYLYFIHQDSTQEGFRSLEVGFGGRLWHIQCLPDLREAELASITQENHGTELHR